MKLQIHDTLYLELVHSRHVNELYQLAQVNYDHIAEWMPWIQNMHGPEFMKAFVKRAQLSAAEGREMAFVVVFEERLVGRVGIYKIDQQNKSAEIGYWLGKDFERQGIMVQSVNVLLKYCFDLLRLQRIEIRCGEFNTRSQRIPEKLNFRKEGLLKNAEFIGPHFHNLYLYALCREDYEREM
jgi:ribosomal-protein-serine acetyltransferase